MADISTEISNFRNAIYGEDVRNSMIRLAEKVNTEAETATSAATTAQDSAAASAASALEYKNNASTSATNAASSATAAATSAETAASTVETATAEAVSEAQGYAEEAKEYRDGAKTAIEEAAAETVAEAQGYAAEAKTYRDEAETIVGIGFATTETAGIVKPDGTSITVDTDGTIHGASTITVDSALSTTSENPVQNKTITSKVGTTALTTTASDLSGAVNELKTDLSDCIGGTNVKGDAWLSNVTYVVGDMVISGNTLYYCKAQSLGNQPPNTTYWKETSLSTVATLISNGLTGSGNTTFNSGTITAGSITDFSANVQKTGYTPIGVVGIHSNYSGIICTDYRIVDETTLYVKLYNRDTSDVVLGSFYVTFTILYRRIY